MKSYCKGLKVTREMVAQAYQDWLAGQSGHKNGWRVEREHGSANELIDEIHREIRNRTLSFRPIRRYVHHEPTNGKVRVIGVESVKQQVCDYVAVDALRPLLDARLGFYQCAGVPGKGQRLCRTALRKWSREGGYFVKVDVRQCYPSCSPEVVLRVLRKYVKSQDVLYVCERLMSTYDRGMEIGSYFSLCALNLVLSFAYHHVEGLGKVRRGRWRPLVSHQIWHMDDCLLMGRDKRDLRRAARSMERFLRDELGLALKPWKVCRVSATERPDMGGWVAADGRCTLRGGTFVRGRRAYRRFRHGPSLPGARRVCSYWGWFRHADLERLARAAQLHRGARMASSMVGRYERLGRPCRGRRPRTS